MIIPVLHCTIDVPNGHRNITLSISVCLLVYNADDLPVLDLVLGGDQTVPEAIELTSICDPFAVDVYYLGNAMRAFLPEVGIHPSSLHSHNLCSAR